MKYEVTGDTIVIKYIADGKYKTLELNKNDNIDLDFFGQLIKAKNNKQDAMCDLYAKEVLSYDPSPERITNMNLTKIDEPSEYTKKEAAKLRIEELNRDLESVEKTIRSMIVKLHEDKRIEDLTPDYLEDKSKKNVARYNELKNRYYNLKELIDKQQKIYDTNNKKENLTQDELIRTLTDKIGNKINRVVPNSDDRYRIMQDISDELKPNEQIIKEIKDLKQHLKIMLDNIDNKLNEAKPEYIKKQKIIIADAKQQQELLKDNDDDKDDDKDDDEDDDKDEQINMLVEKHNDDEYEFGLEDEAIIINEILEENADIKEQKELVIDHINILVGLLEKTDIETIIIETLKQISIDMKEFSAENGKNIIEQLNETLKTIEELNKGNKIMYTQKTFNTVLANVNKILLENERIKTLYNKKITPEFFDMFKSKLPEITDGSIQNLIKIPQKVSLTQEVIDKLFDVSNILLIWRLKDDDFNIYSNINLFGLGGDKKTEIKLKRKRNIKCYAINKHKMTNYNFSLFSKYISTNKSNFKLPFKSMELYIDLQPKTEIKTFTINSADKNFTYIGFNFNQTNVSNILEIVTDFGNGLNYKINNDGGKIDLDKADTEDKLSEIVRLLQNISYNLFTLTPNYEESEKNKRLKSKGIDLKQLFD